MNCWLLLLMFCSVICKRDQASEQLNSYKLSKVSTLLIYCQFQLLLAAVYDIVSEDLQLTITRIFVL